MSIFKKVTNKKGSASKSERVHRLVDYIASKAEFIEARGFLADDLDAQKAEMFALSLCAKRSPTTVHHYVWSLSSGETPTKDQINSAIDVLCKDFGVNPDAHQIIAALHQDTDNPHVHIAINRVSLEDGKAKRFGIRGFDKKACCRASDLVDQKQGWQPTKLARFLEKEKGLAVDVNPDLSPTQEARSIELRTGEKSAQRIGQEEVANVIRSCSSWSELHENLDAIGVRFAKKGSGSILFIGEIPIKSSQAGRDCSFSALEKKLGKFEERSLKNKTFDPTRSRRGPRDPQALANKQLGFQQFVRDRKVFSDSKRQQRLELKARQDLERKQMVESFRKERSEKLEGSWRGRGKERNHLRSFIASQHAVIKAELKERQKKEREELRERFKPFPDFATWQRGSSKNQNGIEGKYDIPKTREISEFTTTFAERGNVYYTSTISRERCFVDQGSRISIIKDKDISTLHAAMQLGAEKWGSITLTGSDEHKKRCLNIAIKNEIIIDNPELQEAAKAKREELLKDPEKKHQQELKKDVKRDEIIFTHKKRGPEISF